LHMNKLYLLALLALSVKGDATSDITGVSTDDTYDDWYAGDCLDSLDTDYGYVMLDCGDSCSPDGGNSSNDTDYETEYTGCFGDNFATSDDSWTCVAYAYNCYWYGDDSTDDSTDDSDDTTCLDAVYACEGDATCSDTAVCNGDDTCSSDLETAIAEFESEYSDYFDDTSSSRKVKASATLTTADLSFRSLVYLYGSDTEDYPTYCDHYHLYDFGWDTATAVDDTTDSSTDLNVNGVSMVGFPNLCSYVDWLGISTPFSALGLEETIIATSADQWAWTCGYYVTYEWNGEDDGWFIIAADNAVSTAISAIALATVGSLLF